MPSDMPLSARLVYAIIAACLFIAGLVLIVMLFWLVFPAVVGLGLWLFALLFLNLAIKGRTLKDWNSEMILQRELARGK